MEQQKVVISHNLSQTLTEAVESAKGDKLMVLADETTREKCWPLVSQLPCMSKAHVITIGATDTNKTLQTLSSVWQEMQLAGATRHSLLVNIGGGMVTDLGGFAASTFKRGMTYINVPTTLLSMVDASVGGKTGINFGGLKNEIGVFNNAHCVILDTTFLATLDTENMLSGYAEMLKHGLISNSETWAQLLKQSPLDLSREEMSNMVAESVAVKQRIVTADPTERGLRKALNLGHTAGHAFESLALKRNPILHGYAVAYGLVVELYLCCIKTGFPTERMRQTVKYIRQQYGQMTITCDDYPELISLMHHDKKNRGADINFTLLGDVGDIRIDQTATEEEIGEALDFYRET